MYKFFDDVERLIGRTLVASKVIVTRGNQTIDGYYLNPYEYLTLYNHFHSYWMQYQRIVHEVTGVPLAIPQWAIDNRPAQVWTASKFELFAIKYREEAESFLSAAFNHRDAVYRSPKPSRREFKRQLVAYRAEQDPIPEEEEQEEKQGSYLPATLTSHHSAPIPTPSSELPPPAVPQIEVQ